MPSFRVEKNDRSIVQTTLENPVPNFEKSSPRPELFRIVLNESKFNTSGQESDALANSISASSVDFSKLSARPQHLFSRNLTLLSYDSN